MRDISTTAIVLFLRYIARSSRKSWNSTATDDMTCTTSTPHRGILAEFAITSSPRIVVAGDQIRRLYNLGGLTIGISMVICMAQVTAMDVWARSFRLSEFSVALHTFIIGLTYADVFLSPRKSHAHFVESFYDNYIKYF